MDVFLEKDPFITTLYSNIRQQCLNGIIVRVIPGKVKR
jgi:hypothetical protein